MKAASPGAVMVKPPCAPLYPPPNPKLPPKTALPLPLRGPLPRAWPQLIPIASDIFLFTSTTVNFTLTCVASPTLALSTTFS